MRTPVLLRWDGHVKPASHERLVQAVDVVPTLLSAAGLSDAIPDLPGLDLVPSATGREALPERPAFGEVYPNDASTLGHPSRDLLMRWMRLGRWKLIVRQPGAGRPAVELFNLAEDPEEQRNLASHPQHAGRAEQMRARLDAWWLPGND
jgi:uncharacterized sulfatase